MHYKGNTEIKFRLSYQEWARPAMLNCCNAQGCVLFI